MRNRIKKITAFLKKINFNKFIYKFYYYVPPCPACKSSMTGKFMRELSSEYENEWRLKTCLKNGEIIAAKTSSESNCFCLNCGNEWNDIISLKLWSKYKIAKQKELRKTDIMLENLINEEESRVKSKKQSMFSKYMGHF